MAITVVENGSMWRWLYSGVFYLITPLLLLRLWWRGGKNSAYRQRIAERFGFHSLRAEDCLWIHAVSVGEVLAAGPLIEKLLQSHPDLPLLITTTTPTGSERVVKGFGRRVLHCYAPYDLPGAVRRFLTPLRPRLLVVMETEIWPNLLHQAKAAGIRIVLANARLSERSARGYRRIAPLTRSMLQDIDRVAVQSVVDGERFIQLGLPQARLEVIGSIKFDLPLDPAISTRAQELRQRWGVSRPVWIAGSTHPGEDEVLLDQFVELRRIFPNLLLILVPRHPERFEVVKQRVGERGWRLACRSEPDGIDEGIDVLLGDTMGELLLLYASADIAFVGGSLVPHGGHNMLEPLALGVATVVGSHLTNFLTISEMLQEQQGLIVVASAQELRERTQQLLADRELRLRYATRGEQLVAANRGALDRLIELLDQQILSDETIGSTR